MRALVAARIALGARVVEFHLRAADGGALPAWQAGAHVQLALPGPEGEPLLRHYSLVGEPGAGEHYRIAVLLERQGTGGSRFMHERVGEGDVLELSGPFNTFALAPPGGRTLLLAGGIGITPLLSMAHALASRGRACELHYVARTPEQMVLVERFRAIALCTVHTYASAGGRPDLGAMLGRHEAGAAIYACGPAPLLQELARCASGLGWPAASVRVESFGARRQAQDQALTVHLAQSGIVIGVAPGTPILDALIDAGMFVSYECRRGECGHCYTPVLEGSVEHRDVCLGAAQRAEGMCPCVSWADGERLVLDL